MGTLGEAEISDLIDRYNSGESLQALGERFGMSEPELATVLDHRLGSTVSARPDVIELIYAVLSDPAKMERLIHELSRSYDQRLEVDKVLAADDREPRDGLPLNFEGVEVHLNQASALFERLFDKVNEERSVVEGALPAIAHFDQDGRIDRVTDLARDLFDLAPGDRITDIVMDGDVAVSVQEHLRALKARDGNSVFSVLPVYGKAGERRFVGFVASGQSGATGGNLVNIQFGWSAEAGRALSASFGLTPTESDILRSIVEGKSLAEHADMRGRSIETVRTQAKSLLTKTGAKSQSELVRIFTAISFVDRTLSPKDDVAVGLESSRGVSIVLDDGRNLFVELAGPPNGEPVVVFHNMFGGLTHSAPIVAALKRHNIRLICPWRPGFYRSDPHVQKVADAPRSFVQDLKQVLDTLGVSKTIILAQGSSSLYAAAALRYLPDRICDVIALGGFVPMLSRKQIDSLSAWPRIFAYTARYFPAALSMLIRGTLGMVISRRLELLLNDLYQQSESDSQVLKDPEALADLWSSFEAAFVQGTHAYETDARLAALDWSAEYLGHSSRPITYLHGRNDVVTPLAQVEDVARQVSGIHLVVVEDAGQLMLHEQPDVVLAEVKKMLGRFNRS